MRTTDLNAELLRYDKSECENITLDEIHDLMIENGLAVE